MKKLIPTLCFILFSNLTYSQIRKAGDFYELNDLWKRDSTSVKQLMNKFNLNISKLDTVQFFNEFDFNKELHDEYSHTAYIYTLYKQTGVIKINSFYVERAKAPLNKYVMVFCFDDYTDKKIINIKVF